MEIEELQRIVEQQKNAPVPSIPQRIEALKELKYMLLNHEQEWIDALAEDLGKPAFETFATEIAVLLNEIEYVIKQVSKWTTVPSSRQLKLGYIERIKKKREPFGSVLIISPWNYPLQLSLMPAISAIAAGNRCVIKPSEYSPATSRLLEKVIFQTFPSELMFVVRGGAERAKELTQLNFDLIFFTGSGDVGKLVLQQASNRLTPVILELGGKSPCMIDDTGYSKKVLQHIIWGKFLNVGQTCIAPDTLFVHEDVYEKVLLDIPSVLKDFYGEDACSSRDYGRISHLSHFLKLKGYLSQGKILYGGSFCEKDLYMEPTVLIDIVPGSSILKEEIFGPILPIIPYKSFHQLLSEEWIQRDALVSYLFSTSKHHRILLERHVKSTVLSVNGVIQHITNREIAFGGIGRSGFGSYHGKAGFDSFSYEKATYDVKHLVHFRKKFPPYSDEERNLLKKWRKWLL